jgi:hypothetical protein
MPPSEREGDRRIYAVVEGACEREVLHYLWNLRTNSKNPKPLGVIPEFCSYYIKVILAKWCGMEKDVYLCKPRWNVM